MVIVQQLFLINMFTYTNVSNINFINFIFVTVYYHKLIFYKHRYIQSYIYTYITPVIGSRIEFSNLEAESRVTANCANVLVKNY